MSCCGWQTAQNRHTSGTRGIDVPPITLVLHPGLVGCLLCPALWNTPARDSAQMQEGRSPGAGGHRHGAQAGRAGGALAHCGAGQAPNRARRCALCPAVDWAPPTGGCRLGVVLATCQMADGSCLGDRRWSVGGRTREATRAIYHQSASLHAQTDRGIVIYERNESRNKSEGVVEVCTAPKITFRVVSLF